MLSVNTGHSADCPAVTTEPGSDATAQKLVVFLKSLTVKDFVIGGGGGSRTRVRKNFQQRAFMLFPVHFCLVIDA